VKQFINEDIKFGKPRCNADVRKYRTQMIVKGFQVYDDVYGYANEKSGFHFLQNDWFMGPFYSHNQNAKDLSTGP